MFTGIKGMFICKAVHIHISMHARMHICTRNGTCRHQESIRLQQERQDMIVQERARLVAEERAAIRSKVISHTCARTYIHIYIHSPRHDCLERARFWLRGKEPLFRVKQYVCVYIYIYRYKHTYIHTYWKSIHAVTENAHVYELFMYACIYAHVCIYTTIVCHQHAHIHMHILHTYIHTYICIFYIHTYTHTCAYSTYIHTYIHTYICIFYIHTYAHTYAYSTYKQTHIHMHVLQLTMKDAESEEKLFMYVYVCVHIYIYIYNRYVCVLTNLQAHTCITSQLKYEHTFMYARAARTHMRTYRWMYFSSKTKKRRICAYTHTHIYI